MVEHPVNASRQIVGSMAIVNKKNFLFLVVTLFISSSCFLFLSAFFEGHIPQFTEFVLPT